MAATSHPNPRYNPKTGVSVPKQSTRPPLPHDVFKYNVSQGKLLLVSLPEESILGHVAWNKGGPDEDTRETNARDEMNRMRDRWWGNARHYCGDRLEIREVQDPTRRKLKEDLSKENKS